MKKLIVLLIMLLAAATAFGNEAYGGWTNVAYGQRPGQGLLVAASNAPEYVKHAAWKICNGTNDEVEIQAAIDHVTPVAVSVGSAVVLSEGVFNIQATITLRTGMTLRGQGNNVTTLYLVSSSNCDMFEFDEIGGSGTFLTIRDMLLYGNDAGNTSGNGLNFKTECKDLNVLNVFVDDFDEDGMHIHGCWGHIYDNVIVEYCTEDGIDIAGKNEHTVSGDTLATANVAIGESYTQAVSGASGRSIDADTTGATTMLLTSDDDDNALDGTNEITFSGGGKYTPTGSVQTTAAGPKINNCKVMDNAGNQMSVRWTQRLACRNSEFNTLGTTAGIVLDYVRISAIQNCIFNGMTAAGTGAYIDINYTDNGSNSNIISGNVFEVDQDSKFAITSSNNNNVANLIGNNVCRIGHAGSGLFNETSSQRRNKLVNNIVISSAYLDLTFDKQLFDLPNDVYTTSHYAESIWHSNALYTASRLVHLPVASSIGMEYCFLIEVAQQLQINPDNADTIYKNDGDGTFTALAAGEYFYSSTVDSYIILKCLAATKWYAVEQGGTWVEETP